MKQEEILQRLAKAFGDEEGPKTISKNYVNPTAAALLVGAGFDVKKSDGTMLSLTPIQKMDILQDFNRNSEYVSQEAQERLALIFDSSAFMNHYKIIYGDRLTIPIDMRASLSKQLSSSIRAGTQTGINRRELGAVFGIELYMLHVELQKDIPIELLRNNLNNPNFENELDAMLNTELGNDFLRLATNGYSDAYSAIGADFYTLSIGFEKILQSANGSWTNSNGKSLVIGRFGNKVTPNKVNIGSVTGITSATETPTAPELLKIFDGLIDNHPHDYRDRNNVIEVAPEEYDTYIKARSMGVAVKSAGFGNVTGDVGINTAYRDQLTSTWLAPPYRGKNIIANPMKRYIGQSVGSGAPKPNVIFAPLEEFYIGAQKRIDQARKYEPRSSDGGPAIEITKHFWIDFQIRNREACSIAYFGATCETPVLADSDGVKADNFISGAIVAATTIYPYCDTKGVRIFIGVADADQATATALVADLATAVAAIGTGDESTAEVAAGDAYLLTEIGGAKTYYAVRAFKDGILLKSTVVEVSVDIS